MVDMAWRFIVNNCKHLLLQVLCRCPECVMKPLLEFVKRSLLKKSPRVPCLTISCRLLTGPFSIFYHQIISRLSDELNSLCFSMSTTVRVRLELHRFQLLLACEFGPELLRACLYYLLISGHFCLAADRFC